MAEYGARKVYDKNGKYIGEARWRRPTDEISSEERQRRQERFDRQCFKFMDYVAQEKAERAARGEPDPENIFEGSYSVPVDMTPDLIAEIDKTLGPIKRC
ncbi:MAG: hypothetical protein NC120_03140 [Ruminococcus sp.]|nr:hypothetical protein [Ruminococcus sp.]